MRQRGPGAGSRCPCRAHWSCCRGRPTCRNDCAARRITPEVEWHEAPAEGLPFAPQSFDAVVSQFGLMFFLIATRRSARCCACWSQGRCVVAVWDTADNVPAFSDLVGLLDRTAGKAAGDALRAPFVLGDKAALLGLFEEAADRAARQSRPIAARRGSRASAIWSRPSSGAGYR